MPKSVTLTLACGRTVDSLIALQGAWASGCDFQMSTTGQYCSVRDYAYLKADYDNIIIRAMHKNRNSIFECCIWSHPLAGLTTYV